MTKEEEEKMKAVVLAGGKGTRLAPYTRILPKPLMPIGDMPILEVLLRQMKRSGIQEVVLTVGHLAHLLRTFFTDGGQWGVNISYSQEQQPLGTAGPLSLIQGLDSTFLVTNGDVLTTLDLRELLAFHQAQGGICTIAVHRRQVHIDLGVIQWNGDNCIGGYIEKPTYDYTVSMGIYLFEPHVMEYHPFQRLPGFPRPGLEADRGRRTGQRLHLRRLLDGPGTPGRLCPGRPGFCQPAHAVPAGPGGSGVGQSPGGEARQVEARDQTLASKHGANFYED